MTTRSPVLWKIKNPLTLEIHFRMADGIVTAEFPALSVNPDLEPCVASGRTMDEAILNLARKIQEILEPRIREGAA